MKNLAKDDRHSFLEKDKTTGKNVTRYDERGFFPIFKSLTLKDDEIIEAMDDGANGRWMIINKGYQNFQDTRIAETLPSYANALKVIGKALEELNRYKGNKLKLTDLNIVELLSEKEGNMPISPQK